MAETDIGTRHKWMPVIYANYYGILIKVAERLGYALAIHGSMGRDFDLIAVAWTDHATSPEFLVYSLAHSIGADGPDAEPEQKPHGRMAYTIGTGGGGYIDISVIGSEQKKTSE